MVDPFSLSVIAYFAVAAVVQEPERNQGEQQGHHRVHAGAAHQRQGLCNRARRLFGIPWHAGHPGSL
jgi:hypothetical protein